MRKMKFHPSAAIKNMMRRDQHVFVSMTTSALDVSLYEQGFLGWREAAFAHVPLESLGENLELVKAGISKVIEEWHLRSQTHVSWVLPPDIVSVVHNKTAAKEDHELDKVFPFSRDEISISKAWNGRDVADSILWVHGDWVSIFHRMSQEIGLQCRELFTRAQLFTALFPNSSKVHSVLIDVVRGETFLHIFNGKHEVVRSRNLGSDRTVSLNAALERELAAIGDGTDANLYCVGISQEDLQQKAGGSTTKAFCEFATKSPSQTLRTLALSLQQGIEIDSAIDTKIGKTIVLLTAVAAGIALVALGAVLWHDSELKTQIEQDRASVRKDFAVYEDAKVLRLQSMRWAKAIELKNQFTNQIESFRVLADALRTLGPSATLQYFSQDGANVRIAGVLDTGKNNGPLLKDAVSFRDVQEIDPRSIKETPNAMFARHLVWTESKTGVVVVPSKVNAP